MTINRLEASSSAAAAIWAATCPDGYAKCPEGSRYGQYCINRTDLCNGRSDCRGNHDEDPEMCADYICTNGTRKCNNGICIQPHLFCNGQDDCGDLSDESPDVCPPLTCSDPNDVPCPGGRRRCIMFWWLCDGDNDCGDNSDEDPQYCHDHVRVRLVGGASPYEGRLEVYNRGVWGIVCNDYSFGHVEATVACQSIGSGLVGYGLQNTYMYDRGRGPIWLTNVRCNGSETFIGDCFHLEWGSGRCQGHSRVYIACANLTTPSSHVRLAGSESPYEGRLEVFYNGFWGTVCNDHFFDDVDATVACRSIGAGLFGQNIGQRYGPGTGPVWLGYLRCNGSETDIRDCGHYGWGSARCEHDRDVSIRCTNVSSDTEVTTAPPYRPSSFARVRLVSNVPYEGRLEVYHNGEWGTVCDDSFGDVDATVACKSLGPGFVGRADIGNRYGPGRGRIWLDQVECNGSENNIADCSHNAWGSHDCRHSEDVSIRCFRMHAAPYGRVEEEATTGDY